MTMHAFLTNNHDELIGRCKAKVAARPKRAATEAQLSNGIPMFLSQLIRTLKAEEAGEHAESIGISGSSGGDGLALSEIGVSAAVHGASLLGLGYTVDQVVHDYGDLCQAITDLAFERDAPFAVEEFRTLNRCLDNAIADAVLEFTTQRDALVLSHHTKEAKERVGFLVHELRNALSTASVAVSALEFGNLNLAGATGAVLKRSLATLGLLIGRAVDEVRQGTLSDQAVFSVASFIEDAETAARLAADAAGCRLRVHSVLGISSVRGNRAMLHAALGNLLQNAFKFTHAHTEISLRAYISDGKALIEVHDHCGGLPQGTAETMFTPFLPSAAPIGQDWGSAWPLPGTASKRISARCPSEMFPGQDACSRSRFHCIWPSEPEQRGTARHARSAMGISGPSQLAGALSRQGDRKDASFERLDNSLASAMLVRATRGEFCTTTRPA